MAVNRSIRAAVAVTVTAVLSGMLAIPAQAHHSFAMFDRFKHVTITGTVTGFAWVNPHSILELDVPDPNDAAKTIHYTIETGSPSKLADVGWKFNEFKPGDKVVLVISPLRDGRPGGSFVKATFADGRVLGDDKTPPLKVLPR